AGLLGKPSDKQVANADKEDDDAADNLTPRKTDIPTRPVNTAARKVDNGPEKSDEAPKPSIKPSESGKRPGADLPKVTGPFPRRALLISVDNYLFMNPINYGVPG